ncbi:uncharacterized protein DUF563 [Natronoflexus pectinivorans]|uniref:Uncharacterized protein DUF563 n=2 Tax=Natronoflexus pectinivorans TaxID=682526 RepID=A0A4R2GFC1_9BACT|nr:uncharacterized protein DUF563 [Natronoflexus pectinivorans]
MVTLKKILNNKNKIVANLMNLVTLYKTTTGEIMPDEIIEDFHENSRSNPSKIRIYNNVKVWHQYSVIEKYNILSIHSFVNSWDLREHVKNKLFRNYLCIDIKGYACSIDTPFSKNNYYHLFIESIPRLWFLRNSFFLDKIITLLLPYKRNEKLELLFKAFNKNIEIKYLPEFIRAKCEYYIELPFLSKSPDDFDLNSGAYFPESYRVWFKNHFGSILRAELPKIKPFRKIYISRQDASVRKFTNDEEISDVLLRRYDIETVIPGKLSLNEQAELFHNSYFIISPHGAGLTNLIWCQNKGGALLEIFSSKLVSSYRGFELHAKRLNFFYDSITLNGSTRNENVVVNTDLLCEKIDVMLDKLDQNSQLNQ